MPRKEPPNANNDSPAETTTSDLSQSTTVLQRGIEGKSYLLSQCPPILKAYFVSLKSRGYGGPQLSHQNQMLTANYKSLTSNSNRSHQIQIAHSKFKSLTANSNRSQRITNRPQQITNHSQQIQIAHSKFKSFTAN